MSECHMFALLHDDANIIELRQALNIARSSEADLNARSEHDFGHTLLTQAAANGQILCTMALALEQKVDLNATNEEGLTALEVAVENDQVEVVRFLANYGNVKLGKALKLATVKPSEDCVNELFAGTIVIDREEKKRSLMSRAQMFPSSLMMLAKADVVPFADAVQIIVAVDGDHVDCLEELINRMTEADDVNVRDDQQMTPLMTAAKCGNGKCIQKLLELSSIDAIAVCNQPGMPPMSAVDFALHNDDANCVMMLVKHDSVRSSLTRPSIEKPPPSEDVSVARDVDRVDELAPKAEGEHAKEHADAAEGEEEEDYVDAHRQSDVDHVDDVIEDSDIEVNIKPRIEHDPMESEVADDDPAHNLASDSISSHVVGLPDQHQCTSCDYTSTKLSVNNHFRQVHTETEVDMEVGDKDLTHFACTDCSYVAMRKSDLTTHKKRKHQMKIGDWPCTLCDNLSTSKKGLQQHERSRRHLDKVAQQVGDTTSSPQNDLASDRNPNLRQRSILAAAVVAPVTNSVRFVRLSNGLYKCIKCAHVSAISARVSAHYRRAHTKLPMRKCMHCSYSTKYTGNMSRHRKAAKHRPSARQAIISMMGEHHRPTGEVPAVPAAVGHMANTPLPHQYSCKWCSYSCVRQSDFTLHMNRQHRRDMPPIDYKYNCVVCDYSTGSNSNLRRHQMCRSHLENVKKRQELLENSDRRHTADGLGDTSAEQTTSNDADKSPVPLPRRLKSSRCVRVSENLFKCAACNFKRPFARFVYDHYSRMHKSIARPIPRYLTEPMRHRCPHCRYATNYITHLNRHAKSMHKSIARPIRIPRYLTEPMRHRCQHCRYATNYSYHLSRHVKSMHKSDTIVTVGNEHIAGE